MPSMLLFTAQDGNQDEEFAFVHCFEDDASASDPSPACCHRPGHEFPLQLRTCMTALQYGTM